MLKTCRKCGKEQDINGFDKNKRMLDRHLNVFGTSLDVN
jgi:hypothetical protein